MLTTHARACAQVLATKIAFGLQDTTVLFGNPFVRARPMTTEHQTRLVFKLRTTATFACARARARQCSPDAARLTRHRTRPFRHAELPQVRLDARESGRLAICTACCARLFFYGPR